MRNSIPLLTLASALLLSAPLIAEPPRILSAEPEKPAADKPALRLPITPEATEEQQAEFARVIAESKETNVDTTDTAALLYYGLGLTQDEIYDEAIPFFEEVLRRDPSRQPAWEGLGWCYIKQDDLEKGIDLWQYFRYLMPEESLPYTLLAQGEILKFNWKEADKHFRKSLSINPNQFDTRFWFAQNLLRIGETDEADTLLTALIKEEPERLDILLTRGELLAQKMQYEEAVEIFRTINAKLPGNPQILYTQAVLELRVGELLAADQLCRDILAIDPNHSNTMRLRADIAEIDGQHDLRPLQEIISQTTDPIEKSALNLRLANRCHIINQRHPGTYSQSFILGLMADAITNDASNVENRLLYAERLIEANRFGDAEREAKIVLEQYNRHNTRAKMVLFESAVREKRFEDAKQILRDRYSNFDSSDPMAHYYRARIDVAEGNYVEALKELDRMEAAANQGCVLTLLYHELTESDWMPVTSVRRLHEHITALQREGFILVSPTQIPEIVGLKKGEIRAEPEVTERPPLTARTVDYIRWTLTGERKFKKEIDEAAEADPPKKYFTITFDDALRSSLELGQDVAEKFGVPFGIFTPTEPPPEYVPSRAGWEELRKAAESGYWVVGSQLHSTYLKKPIDHEGLDLRSGLSNRTWIESKNRQESMNEWDRRMRREFTTSRRIIKEELKESDAQVALVAYPFGDIGQEDACNLLALLNPMQSILSEAARTYNVGFVQNLSGYTVSGDNLMLTRRYEPGWTAEGSDVVRHAYEFHPLFIARKMRAEIAMLMNKPNLAEQMIDLLRRDGYPEELSTQMEQALQIHFRNLPNRDLKPITKDESEAVRHIGEEREIVGAEEDPELAKQTAEEAAEDDLERKEEIEEEFNPEAELDIGSSDPLVEFKRFNIGAEISQNKANDQIEILRYGLRSGFNINRNTSLSFQFFASELDQTVRPRWNAQVTTNVPYAESIYKFENSRTEFRAGIAHRLENGLILSASAGIGQKAQKTREKDGSYYKNLQDNLNEHKFTLDDDDSDLLLTLSATYNPGINLRLHFLYDRDYVASAIKNIIYNSASASILFKPEDSWIIDGHTQYWTYEDDNAMFLLESESLWELSADRGVWGGIGYSTRTTSEPSDFYWTPYWDTRFTGILRYSQKREGYSLSIDISAGMQSEKGRQDRAYEQPVTKEKEILVDGVANTVTQTGTEFVISEDENTGWHRIFGVSGKYERALTPWLDLTIEGEVVALREYIDHFILVYLSATF